MRPEDTAVAAQIALLQTIVLDLARHRLAHQFAPEVAVLGIGDLEHFSADKIARGIAEHFAERLIGRQDQAAEIEDGQRAKLQERREAAVKARFLKPIVGAHPATPQTLAAAARSGKRQLATESLTKLIWK